MSVTTLPYDILIHIFRFTNIKDILQINQIKQFRQLIKTEFIIPNVKLIPYNNDEERADYYALTLSKKHDIIPRYSWLPIKLIARDISIVIKYIDYIHILMYNKLTDSDIDLITNVPILGLTSCVNLTKLPKFTNLQEINLSYCTLLTNESLDNIINAKLVNLYECYQISLLPKFTNLEVIDLTRCNSLTNLSLNNIANANNVKLCRCSQISELPKFINLEEINLSRCNSLTNESLNNIVNAKNVNLSECNQITE